VAKRWWGLKAYATIPDYDQVSFHGECARVLLNDKAQCTIEVVK
jgi:hypothetical protein